MKFEIFRTSDNEKKPCKDAFKVKKKRDFSLFDKIVETTEEYHWEIEIKSFKELMELSELTEDGIIIQKILFSEKYNDKPNEEIINTIEIYDDYKE